MAMPRMSCPVLCPNPHSAPSRDAFTVLRPIVKGVSACRQTPGGRLALRAAATAPDVQQSHPSGSSVQRGPVKLMQCTQHRGCCA